MSVKDKNIVSEALLDIEKIKKAVAEESKATIQNLLGEAIKQSIRESISDDDEETKEDPVDNQEISDSKPSEEDATSMLDANTESAEGDSEENATDDDSGTEEVTDINIEDDDDSSDGDDFAEFADYQTDDNSYDLSGEQDFDKVVSIFKKMDNLDDVIPIENGKIKFSDDETGAEYVVDLGVDEPESSEEDSINEEEDLGELDSLEYDTNEPDDESPAGIPDLNEGKKMKNQKKEEVFEVQLGYTDNYQSKDPIKGLSNAEPAKSGRTIDKGVPTGTEKPWAGKIASKGKPFDKEVNECGDMPTNETPVEEATNVTLPNSRKKSKSHTPDTEKKNYPKNAHEDSVAGNYDAVRMNEAYKKEIKDLKNVIAQLREALNETYVANVNLGKVTKLFVENVTSKNEKVDIISRFDAQSKTPEDAQKLYESISKELKQKKSTQPVLENTVKTVEGSKKINESINNDGAAGLAKIHDFMNRLMDC